MNQMCISLKLGGWYMWSAVWRPGVPEPSRPLRLPFLSFYCPTPDFSNVAVHPQLARLGTVLEPHLPQIMSELKAWFLLGSLSDHIGTYFFCGPKLMWSYVKLGIVKFQIRKKIYDIKMTYTVFCSCACMMYTYPYWVTDKIVVTNLVLLRLGLAHYR